MTFVRTTKRPQQTLIVQSPEITIGVAATHILYSPEGLGPAWGVGLNEDYKYIVKSCRILYTEATTATSSSIIRIGRQSNINAIASNIDSQSGKAPGDVDIIDQSAFDAEPRVLVTDSWTQIEAKVGTGTGKFIVRLELSFDYTDWVGFTPQSPN